jgi:hypothetical protein
MEFEKKTCFVYYDEEDIVVLGSWQIKLKNPRDPGNPFLYTIYAYQLKNKEDIVYRAWNKFFTPKSINDDNFSLKAEFIFNIKTKTISTQTTTIVSDADFFALWYTFIKNFKNLGVFKLCLDCSLYEKLGSLFLNVWKMVKVNDSFLEIHVDDALKGFEKSPNCVLV